MRARSAVRDLQHERSGRVADKARSTNTGYKARAVPLIRPRKSQ